MSDWYLDGAMMFLSSSAAKMTACSAAVTSDFIDEFFDMEVALDEKLSKIHVLAHGSSQAGLVWIASGFMKT